VIEDDSERRLTMRLTSVMRRTADDPRPTGRRRRCGCSGVVGLLVGASLGIAGCGQSAAPVILNTEQVERAIEQSSLAQRNKHVNVSCPSGVHQKKGLTFVCTAVFRGGHAQFVVTELDNAGHVHYEAP
jgi:hypothetical protein